MALVGQELIIRPGIPRGQENVKMGLTRQDAGPQKFLDQLGLTPWSNHNNRFGKAHLEKITTPYAGFLTTIKRPEM
jgi:hypothetical protein